METFDGHIQINHYDAEGLRSGIEEDGRLVQFIFRSQEVVTQLEEEKGMTRYIRGYDLIASDADCARTYYHYASDELGSITHVVAGEDILNRYEYDAWGNLTLCEETVENRFKFNGQQYDPISQQYYLRARYYNPVIGRFTQEDTYRGDGLNLYAYCRNNPVYYADPSGHYRNCVKDAYDRIRQENPGMSAQDAYNLALKETGKERLNSDQGHQAAPDVPTQGSNNRVAGDAGAEGRGNDTAPNTEQNRQQNPAPENPDNRNRQDSENGKPTQSDGGKETELFLPEEYYQKIDDNIARAIAARDAEVARIQTLSKTQQSYIATVVAGVDLRTGDIYVGVKDSRVYRGNATCAEDIVFRGLGGNTNANIIMTPAIRPRNNEVIPVCSRCQTKYPPNQFVRGTTFQ